MELRRNYGTTDRASRLETQSSVTLYTHSSKKTTTNMEHTEIKRYTKKELALLYFPNSSPETARRHLIRWIMRNSKLMEELYAANYSLSDQYLTKEQVEIIFRYIGPP